MSNKNIIIQEMRLVKLFWLSIIVIEIFQIEVYQFIRQQGNFDYIIIFYVNYNSFLCLLIFFQKNNKKEFLLCLMFIKIKEKIYNIDLLRYFRN